MDVDLAECEIAAGDVRAARIDAELASLVQTGADDTAIARLRGVTPRRE